MKSLEPTGSEKTRKFYDQVGWIKKENKVVDLHMFGVKEDGPIRINLHSLHKDRVRSALMRVGDRLNLLECGCGGNPAIYLLDICSEYTGVDFSETGLEVAKDKLKYAKISFILKQADATSLPFDDDQFDAIYSAHMLYHIPNSAGQQAALSEMFRVLKPGGVLVLITANPLPLLFPIRLVKRLVADAPLIGKITNLIRGEPPLPYRPMPLSWYKHQGIQYGSVGFISCSLPSTKFNQNVSEYRGLGKLLWKLIQCLDEKYPKASVYLGNYTQVTFVKSERKRGRILYDCL